MFCSLAFYFKIVARTERKKINGSSGVRPENGEMQSRGHETSLTPQEMNMEQQG